MLENVIEKYFVFIISCKDKTMFVKWHLCTNRNIKEILMSKIQYFYIKIMEFQKIYNAFQGDRRE